MTYPASLRFWRTKLDLTPMLVTLLSSLIELFEAELLAQYRGSLLPSHFKALAAMKDCRTSASSPMQAQCPACDHQVFVPHSCGHRNCPCPAKTTKASSGWNANSKNKYPARISC